MTKPLAKRGYICVRKSAKIYEAKNPPAAGSDNLKTGGGGTPTYL
jgi:hypothetical protein